MKVTIIGGSGKMGTMLIGILERHGVAVSIVGRQTKNIRAVVGAADVVIFSIPIGTLSGSLKMLESEGVELKKKLLIDLSSQVSDNIELLLKYSPTAAFMHFMFGPDIETLKNQRVVVFEGQTDKRCMQLVTIFKKEGAEVIESSPQHHDEMMALVQALSQFSSIALAKTISESDTNREELGDFSSITFSLNAAVISRIIIQKPELWANIQFHNAFFKDILKRHIHNIEKLAELVTKKDHAGFERMFETLVPFWKEEKPVAFVEAEVYKKVPKNAFGTLGPRGSYSEQASLSYLKGKPGPVLFDGIPEVIDAVVGGPLARALLPFENSIHGTVLETLDGIYYRNLKIVDEITISIRHSIAGLDKDVQAKSVRFIYSHTQALGQCAEYIRTRYPHAKLILTPSTSAAFKKIKDEGLADALAIGPKFAAEVNGLAVLEEDIQDAENNQTLFVVVENKKTAGKAVARDGEALSKSILSYTLFVVNPTKDKPGLLHDILGVFKDTKINLLKLESRPARDKLGAYIFYLKAEIRSDDPSLAGIFKELKTYGKVSILT